MATGVEKLTKVSLLSHRAFARSHVEINLYAGLLTIGILADATQFSHRKPNNAELLRVLHARSLFGKSTSLETEVPLDAVPM